MLSIDEAIAHAREVAEDNRGAIDNFLVDDYKQREMCEQCAEEHEQLAEWLEELKTLRAEVAEMHDERQAESAFMREHDEQTRADAIDKLKTDIINKIDFEDKWLFACKSNNADTNIAFGSLRTFVENRAEQLKTEQKS